MNKITIELDTILDKGLLEYLKTIEGIENCDINEGKISIVYKDNMYQFADSGCKSDCDTTCIR